MNEIKVYQNLIINRLNEISASWNDKGILKDSINYSLLNFGKLLRGTILLVGLDDLNIDYKEYVDVAAGLEMIQIYTLVHDDLPIMDDAKTRRGKLTNHLVYNPGISLQAADALLSDSFKIIAESKINDELKIKIIAKISERIGTNGICYGQVLDLLNEQKPVENKEEILKIIEYKTSSFFILIFEIIALIKEFEINTFYKLGLYIGYAFQIKDDLNDYLNLSVGKDNGIDINKSTINKIIGIENTQKLYSDLNKEIEKLIIENFSNNSLFLKYIKTIL